MNPLLDQCHALLASLDSPYLAAFLDEWPRTSKRRAVTPSQIPALRWLPRACRAAPPFSTPLVGMLLEMATQFAWRRSYSPASVGAEFYENYGWAEFAGLTGPVPSDRVACGVLLLAPHAHYPPHRHEAEEIYVPLAGTADWRQGGAPWHEQPPGAVLHHARHEPHAMRTDREPLLALYLWRSEDLAQSSELDGRSQR
jgi:quercetin dioxygenase-like cupin family protein